MGLSETATQKIKWSAKSNSEGFLLCPRCGKKTKTKVRPDTALFHFPLYCPWCRKETVIDAAPTKSTA